MCLLAYFLLHAMVWNYNHSVDSYGIWQASVYVHSYTYTCMFAIVHLHHCKNDHFDVINSDLASAVFAG